MTESKSENSINRIIGTADNPRFIERVPAGARFDFSLNMKLHRDDDAAALKQTIFKGMKLLEMDAIGGSGSRGYGKIRFIGLTENGQKIQQVFDELSVFN
jgi:CRISPR-associated protein Csm3